MKQQQERAGGHSVKQPLKQELLKLERQYWEAIKKNDFETALSLTDNPCVVAGAQGVALCSRERMREMMKASTCKLERYDIKDEDIQVRRLSDDVAIVAYNVHEDFDVDGKEVSFDAADTSTWIKRDGKWVCALHTESVAGDPFGREAVTAP